MRALRSCGIEIYSPPQVDRIWGIWGSYYNMPKAIFYVLKGDYTVLGGRVCFAGKPGTSKQSGKSLLWDNNHRGGFSKLGSQIEPLNIRYRDMIQNHKGP